MAEETQNQQDDTTTESTGNQSTTPPADTISLPKAEFNKRLDRAKRARDSELLKELGITSWDELKSKLNPQTSPADDGLKSELETVKTQLAKLNEIAEQSRQEAEALKAQRRQDSLLATLKSTVKGLRLKETVAEDIFGWATLNKRDLSKLLDADLQPNAAEIEALVNDARTARPEWFKAVGIGSPSAMGKPPTEQDKKRLQDAANAQWAAIKRGG